MRVLFSILFIVSFCAFATAQEAKDVTIQKFTKGILSFPEGELSRYTPISSFNKEALDNAAKSGNLTKENMAGYMAEAKNYKYCLITVGTHTIVKITDLNKTIMSGSWGCKLPYGEGYIQKGSLNFKQDYINNIIGIPDSQRRMIFFFE
ncbi:hypothetical protein E9993_14550 [Labilibacter sediminis]|nr:hypothetical protein E9993_14550 [Labilibacter sediminis]